jgi:hypothetical protein
MNRYKVTMSYWNGEGRERKVLFFDAATFEIIDGQSGPVAIFTMATGRKLGAVHGFDAIELVNPKDAELARVDEFLADPSIGTRRTRPVAPDTMAS